MFPEEIDAPEPVVPLAWEDPARPAGLWSRLRATCAQVLGDPARCGRALGAGLDVGPAVGFFAGAGLPCLWVGAILQYLSERAHPERLAWVAELFPKAPPDPAVAKVLGLAQLVVYPLLLAIVLLLAGVLFHGGLWLTGALVAKRGIDVTFRGLLYLGGATGWILLGFSMATWLPTAWLTWLQLPYLAVLLAILTQLGRILAHAHGAETWRGVLGVFLPCVLCCCLVACCVATGTALAMKAPH